MAWNWQLADWPNFKYESVRLQPLEEQFLLKIGFGMGYLKMVDQADYRKFLVEILSLEGQQSSKIEGELLDRESLQSSIKKCFGLGGIESRSRFKEANMAQVLFSMHETFGEPLTHEMLFYWHKTLFQGASHLDAVGAYRFHDEPMQIVSNRYGSPQVFFEAPASARVFEEMSAFIDWFNRSFGSPLAKAGLAHVYFESIHPFEDGNGRIGRLLVEKMLSRAVGKPVLLAVSKVLEKRKKEYYAALERCNKTLEVHDWVEFFAKAILQAQDESTEWLFFLIKKSQLLTRLAGQINQRQTKALLRMFAEGPEGFQGGMSAEKYIAITQASRATATRDLADLVEKGALIKTGDLRHARYALKF